MKNYLSILEIVREIHFDITPFCSILPCDCKKGEIGHYVNIDSIYDIFECPSCKCTIVDGDIDGVF